MVWGRAMDALSQAEGPRPAAVPRRGASRSKFTAASPYPPEAVASRHTPSRQPLEADKLLLPT